MELIKGGFLSQYECTIANFIFFVHTGKRHLYSMSLLIIKIELGFNHQYINLIY